MVKILKFDKKSRMYDFKISEKHLKIHLLVNKSFTYFCGFHIEKHIYSDQMW